MITNTNWFRQVATSVVAVTVALSAPVAYAAPLPPNAIAQTTLQILNFRSELVSDLSPGTELVFTVEGTPRAKASLTIGTFAPNIAMQEIGLGTYEGHYTIRRNDKISNNTPIRVTLRRGNRTVTAQLNQPLIETASNFDPNANANATTIKQFTVDPIESLEPGTELVFRVIGTSRSQVTFSIAGVVRYRAMDEINPGTYEGRYTVRRNDKILAGVVITAFLKSGGQIVQARLNGGLVNDKEAPTVQNLFPADSSVATTDRPKISGVFDDGRGTGVDPKSVRIRFDGRDVTRDANIAANAFNYQPPRALLPGQYRVEIDLKDLAGNVGRSTWSFDVTRQVAVQPLFIKILSPVNNSTVPVGQIVVRGQSSPGALVSLDVQAASSVVGFLGYSQKVFNESVQADAQGNFTFQFQSVISFQGTRYELLFNATKDNESRQQQLVLFQK